MVNSVWLKSDLTSAWYLLRKDKINYKLFLKVIEFWFHLSDLNLFELCNAFKYFHDFIRRVDNHFNIYSILKSKRVIKLFYLYRVTLHFACGNNWFECLQATWQESLEYPKQFFCVADDELSHFRLIIFLNSLIEQLLTLGWHVFQETLESTELVDRRHLISMITQEPFFVLATFCILNHDGVLLVRLI